MASKNEIYKDKFNEICIKICILKTIKLLREIKEALNKWKDKSGLQIRKYSILKMLLSLNWSIYLVQSQWKISIGFFLVEIYKWIINFYGNAKNNQINF